MTIKVKIRSFEATITVPLMAIISIIELLKSWWQ